MRRNLALSTGYQNNFSETVPEIVYNRQSRERKAKTILAVFRDYFKMDLKSFSLLDVGCSAGFISNYLADHFGQVIGIDIDGPAIDFAKNNFKKDNLRFAKADCQKIEFAEHTFEAVLCTHIYEHVPDAQLLMAEIYRVLKKKGVCYFAAGNRFRFMEPHHNLPFLSAVPRPLAHAYIRITGRSKFYSEKHLSFWGLRKLIRPFDLIDYTRPIIEKPASFGIDYMIQPNSNKAKLAKFISKYAYWLCPTYIWLLRRPATKKPASNLKTHSS